MPRFVLLRHDPGLAGPRPLHWDLMLERQGHLETWLLEQEPRLSEAIPAEALPPHRMAYLDYEGPISEDRGYVECWDRGTFQWLQHDDDEIRIRLDGQRLRATVRLWRETSTARKWKAWFSPD